MTWDWEGLSTGIRNRAGTQRCGGTAAGSQLEGTGGRWCARNNVARNVASSAMTGTDGARTGAGHPLLCVAPNAHFLPKSSSKNGATQRRKLRSHCGAMFHPLLPKPPLTFLLQQLPWPLPLPSAQSRVTREACLLHCPRHERAAGRQVAKNGPPSGAELRDPSSRVESSPPGRGAGLYLETGSLRRRGT